MIMKRTILPKQVIRSNLKSVKKRDLSKASLQLAAVSNEGLKSGEGEQLEENCEGQVVLKGDSLAIDLNSLLAVLLQRIVFNICRC